MVHTACYYQPPNTKLNKLTEEYAHTHVYSYMCKEYLWKDIHNWLLHGREMEVRTGWEGELFFTLFSFESFTFCIMY